MPVYRFYRPFTSDMRYVYKVAHHFNAPFTTRELAARLTEVGFTARHTSTLSSVIHRMIRAGKFTHVARGVYRVTGLIRQLPA